MSDDIQLDRMTLEEFAKLRKNDEVTFDSLFPGLTQEGVVLTVQKRAGSTVYFVVRWLGIILGRWNCSEKEGALTWLFK